MPPLSKFESGRRIGSEVLRHKSSLGIPNYKIGMFGVVITKFETLMDWDVGGAHERKRDCLNQAKLSGKLGRTIYLHMVFVQSLEVNFNMDFPAHQKVSPSFRN